MAILGRNRASARVSRWACWLMLLAVWCPPARAQTAREYEVKAAFLFNFAEFTEWPEEAFTNKDAPLVVGVEGSDPFGALLDETVRNESINGHRVIVERYRRAEDIKTCHILFVGESEAGRFAHVLEVMQDKPTLTVGDSETVLRRGCMIAFVKDHNKIRFRINAEAARKAHINLSSKLLRLGEPPEHA